MKEHKQDFAPGMPSLLTALNQNNPELYKVVDHFSAKIQFNEYGDPFLCVHAPVSVYLSICDNGVFDKSAENTINASDQLSRISQGLDAPVAPLYVTMAQTQDTNTAGDNALEEYSKTLAVLTH